MMWLVTFFLAGIIIGLHAGLRWGRSEAYREIHRMMMKGLQ